MVLRLCMLPGLALLIWATLRISRHIGANGPAALWICVLNPLVIVHLMGGVHNEMLMVGVMMAGIALALDRHPVAGVGVVGVAVAVKATAGLALPFLVWIWMRQLQERRAMRPATAFSAAAFGSVAVFVAVFAALSWIAGVGLGWLSALAGSVKIINWLTLPTAAANVVALVGGLFTTVDFYAVLEVTRLIGVGTIAVALPLLWWRFRHDDREAVIGIAAAMVVVLLVPAALPWYYTWPLAAMSPVAQSQRWIAATAGFSTWIMVIFNPDGSHGMYSWVHVAVASVCAFVAWRMLSTPEPEPDAPLPEPDESATHPRGGHS
jgi:alpha-1,6-mannosyltransferase